MTEADDGPVWLAFAGSRLLVEASGEAATLPSHDRLAALLGDLAGPPAGEPVNAGLLGDRPCLALDLGDGPAALPPGLEAHGLRALHGRLAEAEFQVAVRAVQLVEWLRTHRFCGRCGSPTRRDPGHRALVCSRCDLLHFPRLAPAVIVLVEREGEMLLARSHRLPPGVYSTLAGFVEPGESVEEAVHREIREEAGVEVEDLRWFGSQPWPFPHSLMLAFNARWAGGDPRPDPEEIEDVRWFRPGDLPPLPHRISIARRLIDDFLARHA